MTATDNSIDTLTIREARRADFPVLVDFLTKLALHVAGSPPLTLKKKERKRLQDILAAALADDDKRLLVAELSESGVVGMSYLYICHGQGIWKQTADQRFKSGVIDDTWVEPDYRQRGILSALLRELVAFAESRDVPELMLEYSATNTEAQATWARLGFKTTGIRAEAFTATVKEKLEKHPAKRPKTF
ncbi:MAG: ribosomal protein S18 acetylase RimI-like enzyme [Motiliproteus sp.]|jgi:ribosomal protein S18 acetylase RimI-like enzyme